MKKYIYAIPALFVVAESMPVYAEDASEEKLNSPKESAKVRDMLRDLTYGFTDIVYEVTREARDTVTKPKDKLKDYSSGLVKMLKEAEPHIDIRYRYEFVNQETKKEAKASTISTKLGIKTGKYEGFYAYIEGENVGYIGSERFNNTVNGKTKYATVPDPDATEINQAYIGITTVPNTLLKVGRQTVDMGSGRFIGSQNWRQNETTYDAVVLQNASLDDTIFSYSHIIKQHNEFGDDSPNGNEGVNVNAVEVNYTGFEYSSITPYAYFIEDDDVNTNSNKVLGVIFNGENKIYDSSYFLHSIEYGKQTDYANNSNNFDLDYFRFSAGIKWGNIALTGGREILDGDGTTGMITLLGENHGYNGWEDKFSTIPVNGLEDTYVTLEYKIKGINKYIDGIKMGAQYHNFKAQNGGAKYGEEFDLKFSQQFFEDYVFTVFYETYNADTFSKDTDKVIGELTYRF